LKGPRQLRCKGLPATAPSCFSCLASALWHWYESINKRTLVGCFRRVACLKFAFGLCSTPYPPLPGSSIRSGAVGCAKEPGALHFGSFRSFRRSAFAVQLWPTVHLSPIHFQRNGKVAPVAFRSSGKYHRVVCVGLPYHDLLPGSNQPLTGEHIGD